jgi:hypothetical protein
MRAYLEVIDGRYAGTTIALSAGDVCHVGSRLGVDLFLPHDPSMLPLHFALACDELECQLQDCSGREETYVNGEPISRAVLQHGDWIVAGETLFSFLVDGQPVDEIETNLSRLIAYLNSTPEPLFALVDAALDPGIESLLEDAPGEVYDFHPETAEMMMASARPTLVALPKNSNLLERLVRSGWGKGWCVYLTSSAPFIGVREHFRRHLIADYAGRGDAGFRFFDPRVLRTFLPEFNFEQADRLFYGVTEYLVESQLPSTLLEFQMGIDGVTARSIRLSTPKPMIPSQQQLQGFFSSNIQSGSFDEVVINCLRQNLVLESVDTVDEALLLRLKQSNDECAPYGLTSQAARAQYIIANFILGPDFGQSRAVTECLNRQGLPPDERLDLLMTMINQRRG